MSEERTGIQVIARAAAILRLLEREPAGLSLGEISKGVGLPRSTVQRIVAALEEEQLLISASLQAGVKLGPALVLLGAAADVGTEKFVRPFMQELSRLADETVDLSVLSGDSAVFVEQIQGTQRLAAISAVGKAFPLHCTANGKALLALMPPKRRSNALAGTLKRYTEATNTDRMALESELRDVEATHLAYDIEEHSIGICAVGAAFRDTLGREFSLSIPVPTVRFASKRKQLSKLLAKTRDGILERLTPSART